MNLPKNNKEKFMSEIINLGVGELKIIVCTSNSVNLEITTCDESRRIVIWSWKIGKLIYLRLAHDTTINQIQYQKEERFLWTGGKDLRIILLEIARKMGKWEEVDIFDK